MNMFANQKAVEGVQTETDRVSGNRIHESGLYPAKIVMAYGEKSTGGATAVRLTVKTQQGELKEALWTASGDAKGNKVTYKDKDGKDNYLPGYLVANSVGLLTVGKPISELTVEDKVINIYDFDAKKELPRTVPVFTELLDQDIIVGVLKKTVNKEAKGADGKYHPTGEVRDVNEFDKMFRAKDNMTVAEILAEATEAGYYAKWGEKNTGVTQNKSTQATGNNGSAGAPNGGGAAVKPSKSLFG